MAQLREITRFLDDELQISRFKDSHLNGLQIEGGAEVSVVATTVDAALATVKLAVNEGANLLIAHHGVFWESPRAIVGPLKELVEICLSHKLSIYGVHLPLDAHSEYGNNFALAGLLQLSNLTRAFDYRGSLIGCRGENSHRITLNDFKAKLSTLAGATGDMLTLNFGPARPENVGIVSGSGADVISGFDQDDIDTYITGEPRQFAYHFARENKLNVIFAGHYATETLGVQNLGEVLTKRFGVRTSFLDCPTLI